MRIALRDLKLDHLFIIYPGELQFQLGDRLSACGLGNYLSS